MNGDLWYWEFYFGSVEKVGSGWENIDGSVFACITKC